MKISKVSVKTEKGMYEAVCQGDSYVYEDVAVKVKDGAVSVTGKSTPVCSVEITYENTYFKNPIVLADTWERAYANLEWKKPDPKFNMPWYFLAEENGIVYGFGVKTQPDAMCCWRITDEGIVLHADTRCGRHGLVLEGKELITCEVVSGKYECSKFEAACQFCKVMCPAPRIPDRPIFGGNDWYCNYGNNSHDSIVLHAQRIVECCKGLEYKPYMVVDDGWELCHNCGDVEETEYMGGPWNMCNRNFEHMSITAAAIEEAGAIPGIWVRPLKTVEVVPDEFILKMKFGIQKILDPSYPGVLEETSKTIKTLKDWGYKLIKHDFTTFDLFNSWGFDIDDGLADVEFYDRGKTTAQIIKNLYKTIREAAGDDVLIIGCNTLSHLSAGLFEIQRTGDDTSGKEWARTRDYGINTLAFRMCQHKAFYLADADCVGITNQVDWEKNKQWLDVLSKSGTPLFVSIAKDAYTDEIKQDLTEAFKKSCENTEVSEPIDWAETKLPPVWKSVYGIDKYQW